MDHHDLKRLIEQMDWGDAGALSVPVQETAVARSNVMGYLWSQIAWSELGEPEGTIDEVLEGVCQLSKSFWIPTIGLISVGLAKYGTVETQHDMIEAFAMTPTGARVRELLDAANADEKNRTLFSPKPLAALAKLALAHAPDDGYDDPRGATELFLQTYLRLCDVAEAASRWDKGTDPVRNLLRYMVQEGEHGAAGGFGEPLARLDLLLRRIPEALGVSPSPSDTFEEATGVPLGHFTALAAALPAYFVAMDTDDPVSVAQHIRFDPQELVRLTRATADDVQTLFQALTHTEEDAAAFAAADATSAQFFTDLSRLKVRPLWRWEAPDGVRYVPISIPFLMWRITEGIYWDVVNAASAAAGGGKAGREASGQVMTDFGPYLEAYVQRLVDRAMPSSPILARRFYAGLRIEGKTGTNKSEIDLLIPYGDAFVVVEVKSARFHYVNSIIKGDLDYIEEEDLKQALYDPAAQLEKAIEHLQANAYSLDGITYTGEPIYPVLVTYGGLPTIGPVWSYLLGQLRERNVLLGPNIRPLAALGIDEMEILTALVANGHSARDVLRDYVEGDSADLSFRNYTHSTYGDAADVDVVLRPEYDASMRRFKELFRREE